MARFTGGWVRLDREITDENGPYVRDPLLFTLWCCLISWASRYDTKYFDHKNRKIEIKKGQVLISLRGLAKTFGCDHKKIKRRLDVLEAHQSVTQQTTQSGTLITILNYSKYQDIEKQSGTVTGIDNGTDAGQTRPYNGQSKQSNKKREAKSPPPYAVNLAQLWFTKIPRKTDDEKKLIDEWAKNIEAARNKCKQTVEETTKAITYAINDDWWKKSRIAPSSLASKKNDDGWFRLEVFLNQAQRGDTSNHSVQPSTIEDVKDSSYF